MAHTIWPVSAAIRKRGWRAAACRPRVEVLEDRVLLAVSAQAQQFVYLLNRARHDPSAYEAEVGLPVGLLDGVQARPPLAVNDQLFASSEFHANEMATFDYFGHQSQVTSDWPNKMARDQGYVLPAFFPEGANYIESLAAGFNTGVNPDPYSTADEPLRALIFDEGVNPPGHRIHLLGTDAFNADNREIGVGYAYNPSSAYRNYWAIHATRTDPSDTFLTGVTYDDLNNNGRYDMNEGLGNVTIGAGGLITTTNAMGGWSIAVAAGTYTVTASGGGFTGSSLGQVTVGTDNVEVDFISGTGVPQVNFAAIVLPDRLGAHRDHRFFLDANGNGSWDGTSGGDRLSEFGADGDRPIVGDFNGDGFDDIGVHRGDRFFLDVNGSGGWDGVVGGDALFRFGAVGDTPLVGDFDGDGVDEIGVHRGDRFFLDVNGNGGWDGAGGGDAIIQFGAVGDTPLIGDFNGDGVDDIGVHRGSTFFLDANGNGQWDGVAGGDRKENFGAVGDTPLIGDFGGNGSDSIGVQRGSTFFLDGNGNGRWDGVSGGDLLASFGAVGDAPLVGRWAVPAAGQGAAASTQTLSAPSPGNLADATVSEADPSRSRAEFWFPTTPLGEVINELARVRHETVAYVEPDVRLWEIVSGRAVHARRRFAPYGHDRNREERPDRDAMRRLGAASRPIVLSVEPFDVARIPWKG